MTKFFKNYKTWCKNIGKKTQHKLPKAKHEVQQRNLLIWGEAANIRFIPECLCYIFHTMAFELYGMLTGNVSIVT
ncbi:1,3-beta-glucan synthase subunit FKS1-like, domain-1 [Artemisia annua]|uniref:1,3-beta-glucan synthase subunit FKS1-like, domain-1 n=1 Tax=Artemisia annua TaxID=35608 RepID=A0A2U1KPZ5_ARTAN|nr:1,3-beta-glucan synthase subunit FKS1-like, domain-1 [Artemisia annua]